MDLSDRIFSPGMAYVALSRVRTLNGVRLLAFDPNSITVSRGCLQEINRLRLLFRSDLPAYTLPALKKCTSTRKRKLTGTASLQIEPESKKVKASPAQSRKATGKRCSTVQSRTTTGKRPLTVQSSKATGKRPSTVDSVKEMKKPCTHVDPSSDCLLLSSNLIFTNDGQIQRRQGSRRHALDLVYSTVIPIGLGLVIQTESSPFPKVPGMCWVMAIACSDHLH